MTRSMRWMWAALLCAATALCYYLSEPAKAAAIAVQIKQSVTDTMTQTGTYWLSRYGNSHGWAIGPNPSTANGWLSRPWTMTFDLSPDGAVADVSINVDWKTDAPIIYTVVTKWTGWNRGVPPGPTQPIKYMQPAAIAEITKLVFSDGFTYTLPAAPSSPTGSKSLNLISLGLGSHVEQSRQLTVYGGWSVHAGEGLSRGRLAEGERVGKRELERCSRHRETGGVWCAEHHKEADADSVVASRNGRHARGYVRQRGLGSQPSRRVRVGHGDA